MGAAVGADSEKLEFMVDLGVAVFHRDFVRELLALVPRGQFGDRSA